MPRTVSIYRSLLTSLLLVIVLLSGAVLAITFVQARRAVAALSGTAISGAMAEVEARLNRFFDPGSTGLLMMRDWGAEGRLEFEDADEFVHAMSPVIERNGQITSLMLADNRGREQMLLFAGGKWITRDSRAEQWGRKTLWTERAAPHAEPRPYEKEIDYDCRKRPWFRQALEAKRPEVRWTAPYTFFTTKDPGITASIRYAGPNDVQRVIGFDLMLQDITRFTMALRPSPRGLAFVLTDDARVLGLPGHARFRDPQVRQESLLKQPKEIGVPVVLAAANEFDARNVNPDEPFRFESDGEAWWAGLRWFPLGADRRLALVVVVPESDLLGDAARQRIWIILVTIGVLAFAAMYGMVLARRYSTPMRGLVSQSDRIRDGDFDGGDAIPTRLREVRALAEAQDDMRKGLKTLLKLERDLQIARQIQQGTFPDELPRLPGFEIDAWSVPADETGGDTFDLIGLRDVEVDGVLTTQIAPDEPETALMLLADATGHGIGPALSVTQVRAMLRMAARSGEQLDSIVRHMNEQLCADLSADRFITAWFGVLDARTGRLTCFSAGQGPLLLYNRAKDEFDVFGSDCPPLGIVEELSIDIDREYELKTGDMYFAFTDGIIEAKGPDRSEYGVERLQEVVRRHRDSTPKQILDAVSEDVDTFTGHAPLDDDRTAILIKRL